MKDRIDLSISSLHNKLFEYPNLIESQLKSYERFLNENIRELFDEINPVLDNTGNLWILEFLDYRFGEVSRSVKDAIRKGLSYDRPLYFNVSLTNKISGEVKNQEIFVADLPVMTNSGSFIINGHERVVIHQIVRSEGVLFIEGDKKSFNESVYYAKLVTSRGPWLTFEVSKHNTISVKLAPKKPKILITTLLRALGYSSNSEILNLFSDVDVNNEIRYIDSTLSKDSSHNQNEAVLDIYKKLRPDISITYENALSYLNSMLFSSRKLYLGMTGRYKLNKKLGLDIDLSNCVLTKEDIVAIIRRLIAVNNGQFMPDDVDSLSNRRVKSVGELLGDYIRVGVRRVEKIIKDRMSIISADEVLTPSMLVSAKPFVAVINEFFGSSSVSTLMDQDNILSEISNKRRVTAGGPGGLTKESATFSVRDMHYSQYSRLCPVETPEGPHIGIVNHLSVYSRINDYGFIEAPYRKLLHLVSHDSKYLENRKLRENLKVGGKNYLKGDLIHGKLLDDIKKNKVEDIPVFTYLSDDVEYFDAEEEYNLSIASLNTVIDEHGNILENLVQLRSKGDYSLGEVDFVDYIEVSTTQIGGVSLNLIPFASSNKADRTLMGSNMQKQSVPLVKTEAPIIGTGLEKLIARNSNRCLIAKGDGVIKYADARKIIVAYKDFGDETYLVEKFLPTNQKTAFTQNVIVKKGDNIKKGDVLVDGPSVQNGELALGRNVVVAYMMYDGFNYEDGIVISERLVKEDIFTSIHVSCYTRDIKETRLGDELSTKDIPNVSLSSLKNLDEDGIVSVGSYVNSNDILVGIVVPKGEVELTPEEKLLRAIFGDMARDVRDNSLRVPNGESGIVIDVEVLSREDDSNKLLPGVIKQVKVWVARTHKIGVGDKLAGRYGDKGVISRVVPVEDMPYLEDGTPVDVIISPTSVTKRLNLGQLQEVHYANLAQKLNVNFAFPIFSKINAEKEAQLIHEAGFEGASDKKTLNDGRNGEVFENKIVVGPRYILVLDHLADTKIHARSTGNYTVVNQQPLGGRANMGGQRLGEMEVWALEAYGAASVLQEMLSIKSDDIVGRSEAYKSIIHGKPIQIVGIPESFKVLLSELKSLCLNVEPIEVIVQPESTVEEDKVADVLPEDVSLYAEEEAISGEDEDSLPVDSPDEVVEVKE